MPQLIIALILCASIHEVTALQEFAFFLSIALGLWAFYSLSRDSAVIKTVRKRWPIFAALSLPGGYFVVATLQETVEHTPMAIASFVGFGMLGLGMLTVALKEDDFRPLFRFLAIGAAMITIEGIIEMWYRTPDTGVLLSPVRWFHQGNTLHTQIRMGLGTLPWASTISAWLDVVAACTLPLISYGRGWKQKAFWSFILFVMMVGVFFGGSRIPILAFIGIVLVYVARKPGMLRWVSTAVMAFLIAAIGLMLTMKRSLIRGDGSMRSRFQMWKLCVDLIKRNPLFGGGRNAFKYAWPAYSVQNQYGFDGYLDPHSFYFWILTSGGLVLFGMVALAVFGAAYGFYLIQSSTLPRGTKTLSLAIALGAVAVLGMEVIGTDLREFGMQNLAVVFLSMTTGLALRANKGLRSTP
ncbi:MAG: O-antigen ligase family protein [Chthonomonadales bacterium]